MKSTKSIKSGAKATPEDARIVLKLYDLRRESEMRKARNYFVRDFNPRSAEDAMAVFANFGSQENAWMRQLIGYWEMAASLVLGGALNPELFHGSNGEMYFVYAKLAPFIKQIRQTMDAPEFLSQVEAVIQSSAAGRERAATMQKRMARFAEMKAAAGKK
jgi:hypothetical protein